MKDNIELKFTIASGKSKAVLGFAVCLAALALWFPLKWGFANSAASGAEFPEVAEFAASLAPADPQTRFTYAALLDATLEPTDAAAALREFEASAANSPHNYLIWLDLGRAYERSGDRARAIACYQRAHHLAPSHSLPTWTLGNALLRGGETERALELIADAGAKDSRYAEPAAALILQLPDQKIHGFAARSGPLRSAFISLLTRSKRFDEALSLWNDGGAKEPAQATGLYQELIQAKRYRDALQVVDGLERLTELAAETITNGGFEERQQPQLKTVFDWAIADGAEPRIGVTEGQRRSGSLSLLVNFSGRTDAFRQVTQTVAVEPGRAFVFEAWMRSTLTGSGNVRWTVLGSAQNNVLAVSEPVPVSADWVPVKVSFSVPDDTDGIQIMLSGQCEAARCERSGNLWIDDVSIRRQ